MKTLKGNIYTDGENHYTPAQTGDFYIVDMWKCDKKGNVNDIEENPYPVPVSTNGLKFVCKSKVNYEYPEFNPKF